MADTPDPSDDVMLNYQSTSYHDAATVRSLFGLTPAPEFAAWLEANGITRDGRLTGGEPNALAGRLGNVLPG